METEKRDMRRTKIDFRHFGWSGFVKFATVAIIFAGCMPARSMAQEKGQKTFSSAEAASQALVTAAENNDEKTMLDILGKDAKLIVYSGDEVEDKENRENFVKRYGEMHRLFKEPDGTTTLYIGAMNWPTPIPLMNKGPVWYFDSESAKKEILYRRVGRNEISSIGVCQELAAAEKEYYSTHQEYAQKIFSDAGKQNGLYWKAAEGEPQSPIGPLVAAAVTEGYVHEKNGVPTPYRGYFFHVLTVQGKDAPGGAKSYLAGGKMTNGFAFVAYPAEYRSSGVMTFIVGADGVVYEKDLGKKSEDDGKAMKNFNPDSSWQKAEIEEDTAASAQTKK
jgi:hypothetical protein